MQLDTKVLSENELARVDPLFISVRPGHSKNVTLIFTSGKADPRWQDPLDSKEAGTTFPKSVSVNDAAKTCTGSCLIDLLQLLGDSYGTPYISPAGKRVPGQHQPSLFRLLVVETIVHELMHICQGWQIGNSFESQVREERKSSEIRQQDCQEMFPKALNCVYSQSMFENGSYNFDSRWSKAHRAEVHAGKFDFILPLTVMRGIFPDLPNVYR
jgi:hypothetical protein